MVRASATTTSTASTTTASATTAAPARAVATGAAAVARSARARVALWLRLERALERRHRRQRERAGTVDRGTERDLAGAGPTRLIDHVPQSGMRPSQPKEIVISGTRQSRGAQQTDE